MYPRDVPHLEKICTSHVPHLEFFVPHSGPYEMATLINIQICYLINKKITKNWMIFNIIENKVKFYLFYYFILLLKIKLILFIIYLLNIEKVFFLQFLYFHCTSLYFAILSLYLHVFPCTSLHFPILPLYFTVLPLYFTVLPPRENSNL